jgi:hypothetical protein
LKEKIIQGREFEQEVLESFRKISEDAEANTGGISSAELDVLVRENEQKIKRDLALMNAEFENQFRAIDPTPRYLNDEIEAKERATELLNTKIRELCSELEKTNANRDGIRVRVLEKQKRELEDIQLRANLKLQELLGRQKRVFRTQ